MSLTNIFKKGWYYSHKKLETKAYPTISNVETTNACGMRCIMCPRQYMKRKVGFMDVKLFEKIVGQMKANSDICLHHFGDPMLHPKIEEFFVICQNYGIHSSLSTNPMSLTKENTEKILRGGLTSLHISLDGATKETYEKIRRGRADYNEAIKNIKYFLAEKNKTYYQPKVIIAIIRMKETEEEIETFKKQWEGVEGVDEVQVKTYISWSGEHPEITNLASEYSHKFNRDYIPCFWNWGKLTVLWDGRVVPCCFDYDGKFVLGDLNTQTLEEIWNGPRMQVLRNMQINNFYPEGHLCKYCKEREGFRPSKWYPFNIILRKGLKATKYLKHN
jgi:radical SAM protein with 4Fe4S-binding SPASM domain